MNNSVEYLYGVLPAPVKDLFNTVKLYVAHLKSHARFESCHQVCRDIAEYNQLTLKQKTGYFGDSHEHSWLVIPRYPKYIIDPYPVAAYGGPIIVDTGSNLIIKTPWFELYREDESVSG